VVTDRGADVPPLIGQRVQRFLAVANHVAIAFDRHFSIGRSDSNRAISSEVKWSACPQSLAPFRVQPSAEDNP